MMEPALTVATANPASSPRTYPGQLAWAIELKPRYSEELDRRPWPRPRKQLIDIGRMSAQGGGQCRWRQLVSRHTLAISPRNPREFFQQTSALSNQWAQATLREGAGDPQRGRRRPSREGAGKTGCALHPRSRVQYAQGNAHTSMRPHERGPLGKHQSAHAVRRRSRRSHKRLGFRPRLLHDQRHEAQFAVAIGDQQQDRLLPSFLS